MEFKHNLYQLLIALDQFLNVLICMFIEPREKHYCDETMSAHIYRHSCKGKWKWLHWLVDKMFFWEEEHCKQAYESELERYQLPKEYRDE